MAQQERLIKEIEAKWLRLEQQRLIKEAEAEWLRLEQHRLIEEAEAVWLRLEQQGSIKEARAEAERKATAGAQAYFVTTKGQHFALYDPPKAIVTAYQKVLANALIISDFNSVTYPEGVFDPSPVLNENARDGKFRYVSFASQSSRIVTRS